MVEPMVQYAGDGAVLTFNFNSWGSNGAEVRWHCTEVYRREQDAWRIVHTHWSLLRAGTG